MHTYTTSGTYTVTLQATGECGTDETAITVTVSAPTLTVAFPTDYPCWGEGSDQLVRVMAYVTDGGGTPISDATVTVTIGLESWTLESLPGNPGYYGGGVSCWESPAPYGSNQDVTITAIRAGYLGDSTTGNTNANPSCAVCP